MVGKVEKEKWSMILQGDKHFDVLRCRLEKLTKELGSFGRRFDEEGKVVGWRRLHPSWKPLTR